MGRRNQSALFPRAEASGAEPELERRRAIRESLRRGYREMGRLNLTLAEEGLVFEHLSPAAQGQSVKPGGDP